MMDECKNCANMDNDYCFACDNGNQFKPMTNADRIRSMSDEELAEWASIIENNAAATNSGWLPSRWLGWLRREWE